MLNIHSSEPSSDYKGVCPPALPEPSEAVEPDLVLLALASGLKPEGGWPVAGVTVRQLGRIKKTQAARLGELRTLTALGGILPAPLLTDLLKARLAQRLMASDSAAELERIAKIIERLPDAGAEPRPRPSGPKAGNASPGSGPGQGPAPTLDPDADVDSMELAEALSEARNLIAQLESPETNNALPDAAGKGVANG